jgi:hypothetical protein
MPEDQRLLIEDEDGDVFTDPEKMRKLPEVRSRPPLPFMCRK